jgi:hypothetical protein
MREQNKPKELSNKFKILWKKRNMIREKKKETNQESGLYVFQRNFCVTLQERVDNPEYFDS